MKQLFIDGIHVVGMQHGTIRITTSSRTSSKVDEKTGIPEPEPAMQLVMIPNTFLNLHAAVQQMYDEMKSRGLITEEEKKQG